MKGFLYSRFFIFDPSNTHLSERTPKFINDSKKIALALRLQLSSSGSLGGPKKDTALHSNNRRKKP